MSADRGLVERLLGHRIAALIALAAVTAGLGVFAARVGVEQDNESMSSLSADELAVYDELRRVFGDDEDLFVAVALPRLRSEAGMRALAAVVERIEAVPGVRRVYALTNVATVVPGPDGAEERPLVPPFGAPDFDARLAAALDARPELVGFVVGEDRETAGLLVELEHRPDDAHYRRVVVDALRALAAAPPAPGVEIHFTGIAAQKYEVARLVERDQRVLVPASVVVLALVLVAYFRSVAGVALPLLVTGVTLVWTLGAYRLAGLDLNVVTGLLPPVLMVLSISTSVHLIEHWRRHAAQLADSRAAIAATVRALLFPCVLTSITTAIGLSSLAWSDTPAVERFGVFSALGVMISLGVALTLVPIGLSFVRRAPLPDAGAPSRALAPLLATVSRVSRAHAAAILVAALALTAVAGGFASRIRNDTDLVGFLLDENPLRVDTRFVDAHLTGVNALEVVVRQRDGAALDTPDATRRLAAFGAALAARGEVARVQSVVDLLRAIDRAERPGAGADFEREDAAIRDGWDVLYAAGDADLVRRLVDEDFTRARVRVLMHAIGSAEAAPVEAAVIAAAERTLGDAYRVDVTGSYHQVVRDSNRLVATQVASFATAFGLVLLTIGVAFRSASAIALAVVPNALPVVWTGGLMGWLGIDLSTGTVMIASVVIGIAVDDTIHYLNRYRRERALGLDVPAAIDRTTTGVGRALVVSSVVLVVGFWVGALGSFRPTIHFSLLTGLTMIFALACDLLVLPASLVVASRWRRGSR